MNEAQKIGWAYRERLEAAEAVQGDPNAKEIRQKPHLLFTWLDEYCHRNPRQSLSLATEAMVWSLRDR